MPVRKHSGEYDKWDVAYSSDEEVFDKFPPIDNEGSYVPEKINRKNLIHELDDDQDDSDSDDESIACTQQEPTTSNQVAADPTPIQKITDLVFKDTLFYGGFCFGGVAKQFSAGAYNFKVDGAGAVKIPPTDAQMEKLLNLVKPRVTFNAKFLNGLDLLKAKLAKRIGCSEELFKLVFRELLVHKTGKEIGRHVDKELIENQFGTLFVQPPTKYTGGEMKVYRKLSVEGDRSEEIRLDFGADNESEASKWHFGFIAAEAEHEFACVTSESRVMFVFAAAWNTKHQPQFPGPEKFDRVAAQLELQCSNGEFVVAFLSETYNDLKNVGQQELNKADRSLLRQLDAANSRLEKSFKVVLVSIVRHFVYKECDNSEDIEQLLSEWNFDTVDAEWEFKECKTLQQWYEVDGKPWPQQPNANLELMTNVLNPMKNSLKQLWGMYAKKELAGIPSQDNESNSESEDEEEEEEKEDSDFYNYTATKMVTYKKSLLVLWPPELAIKHVAEFDGWDVAFKTLISKSPDSAALKSLLQLFDEKKGYNDTKELIKDETIRLIYSYIAENNMLDLLPAYIDVFFPVESAFKPIFLTTNEEIWKITESTLLSDLNEHKAVHIMRFLKTAQKDQAQNERRYKLLQACLCLPMMFAYSKNEDIFSLVLPLADEALVEILGDKFFTMESDYYVQSFLEALLAPEFAPLREKFWTSFAPKLQQRIDGLKAAVAKPFDVNHPDLEAIFPKESSQAKWLMHCQAHYESVSTYIKIEDNDLEKAKQVEEQLKTYNLIFSAKKETLFSGEIVIELKKTDDFKEYLTTWKDNKAELKMLVEMEPPSMKYWKDDNLEPPMKNNNLEPPMKDDDGDLEPPMKKQKLQ